MRWGAIFGGWLVASGIASLMYVAGLALGFTAFDTYNAEATAKGIGMGTAIWVVLTWAVALFLGGMFASWFDGRSDQTIGTLHGVTVWGLSIAANGIVLALGLAQAVQGGGAMVGGTAAAGTAVGGMAAPGMTTRGPAGAPNEEAVTGLQAQLTQRVAQTSGASASMAASGSPGAAGAQSSGQTTSADVRRSTSQLDRQTMAAVATALIKGNTDNAKALLAANTAMSQTEVDQALQNLSPQVEKYKADAKAAADAAARYAAAAMWTLFLSSLISSGCRYRRLDGSWTHSSRASSETLRNYDGATLTTVLLHVTGVNR
jgi:hypothetical protein